MLPRGEPGLLHDAGSPICVAPEHSFDESRERGREIADKHFERAFVSGDGEDECVFMLEW